MKFKDKDGNVFEDIEKLRHDYCVGRGCQRDSCGLALHRYVCDLWAKENPAEAARLMGYEVVVEDIATELQPDCNQLATEEADMDKQKPVKRDKPLADWTLGEVKDLCLKNECASCVFDIPEGFCQLHRFPNSWCLDPKTRFTEEEVADAKAIMRVFQCNELLEIVRGNISDELFLDYGTGPEDVGLNHKLFPSIRPGQSVKLSEIVGGADAEKEG